VKGKPELLRFVLAPDRTLVPDLLAKLPGRGAYTCVRESCLRAALTKRQFARSFKGEVVAGDPDSLVAQLAGIMEERIASYLALANKGGKIVSGSEKVMERLKKRVPGVVFMAEDIAADSRDKIAYLAGKAGVPLMTMFSKARLGGLLGKELRSVVAVEQGGFSEAIMSEMDRYRNFFEGGAE
jgi:uncharacterized protein